MRYQNRSYLGFVAVTLPHVGIEQNFTAAAGVGMETWLLQLSSLPANEAPSLAADGAAIQAGQPASTKGGGARPAGPAWRGGGGAAGPAWGWLRPGLLEQSGDLPLQLCVGRGAASCPSAGPAPAAAPMAGLCSLRCCSAPARHGESRGSAPPSRAC